MTGEVLSVLFKGVHYEIMVETVPGTSVTVNMRAPPPPRSDQVKTGKKKTDKQLLC